MPNFKPEELAINEIDKLEEITGEPFVVMAGRLRLGNWATKDLVAVAYVLGRRSNPEFTVEEAWRMKLGDLIAALE